MSELYSVRLTNSNKSLLKKHVQKFVDEEKIDVICAGYECRSIKRQKDVTPHVHMLIEMEYKKNWLNRKANELGYKGNAGELGYNVSVSKKSRDEALQYHCKGDMQGRYEVEILEPLSAQKKHIEWHMEHQHIVDARRDRMPLYLRIVNEIIENIRDYYGRSYEDGTVKIDKSKVIKKIISAYAEADLWFKSDAIEKTYNLLSAKLDVDNILNSNRFNEEFYSDIIVLR